MKKFLFILLLCLSLTACVNKTGGNGSSWDFKEYSSLEEMNNVVGTNIKTLNEEVSDEHFGVISGNLAQYIFKLDEADWSVRASKDINNDISGLHYDDIGFEKDTTAIYYNDEVYACRFFYDDTQYVISVNVKDKDIPRSYFDKISAELQTNITGVVAGYENEIYEDGDDVVYRVVMHNDDGTSIIMETIYSFENDKMTKIISKMTFESEQALQDYLDLLVEYGNSIDGIVVEGKTFTSDMSSNLDFYSDYNKEDFIKTMKDSMAQ